MNPPPPPTHVSTKWVLGSPNQRPNSQRILKENFGGFNQVHCPACHARSCSCFVAEEKELMMDDDPTSSQRSDIELLQNCDLPPPLKIFTGQKETVLKTARSMKPSPPIKIGETKEFGRSFIDDRLGLLKALQLSQTRAREAEKKASTISFEKDHLTAMFYEESSRLFAHRQWIKLLDIEILLLQSQLAVSQSNTTKEQSGEKKEDGEDTSSTWFIALALCLGLAGVGFALSCRYLF